MQEMHANVAESTAGRVLKRLRGDLGLSIQDVAAQLHLDPRIVEAMEADAAERLPAPLYVRGYIRSYAKILRANADPIIALYNSSDESEPPEIIPEVRRSSQSSSRDRPVKAFTYFVTLSLVLLLVAWWQSKFIVGGLVPTVHTQETPAPPPPGLPYTYPVIHHPESPFYHAPPEPEATGDTAAAGAEPSPDESAPANGAVIHSETEGPDTITLRLSADSWIDVQDTNGQKVYLNLGRAGETLHLHGTAPFKVVLGFAQGVNVEFNGKPFDPASFSHSGIARFTLEN